MKDMLAYLGTLTQLPGPLGREGPVAEFIETELRKYGVQCKRDRIGNVLASSNRPTRILVSAHMDQVGFMVSRVDDEIHCLPVGGIDLTQLNPTSVRIYTSIGVQAGEIEPRVSHADEVSPSAVVRTESPENVRPGDRVLFASELEEAAPGIIRSQALDDRIGCYLLLSAARQLETLRDVAFVWTVREEGEYAGILHAARKLDPDIVVSVDVTYASADDMPQGGESAVRLGQGPAVTLRDGGMVADEVLLELLEVAATKVGLHWQREVVSSGISEAGRVLRTLGVPGLALLVPVKHEHSPMEEASTNDIAQTLTLLVAILDLLGNKPARE